MQTTWLVQCMQRFRSLSRCAAIPIAVALRVVAQRFLSLTRRVYQRFPDRCRIAIATVLCPQRFLSLHVECCVSAIRLHRKISGSRRLGLGRARWIYGRRGRG